MVREVIISEIITQDWLKDRPGGPKPGSVRRLVYEFSILFERTMKNYIRNPGNAMARISMIMLVAILQVLNHGTGKSVSNISFFILGNLPYVYVLCQGLAFYRLDSQDSLNRIGALFFSCMSLALAPYASMSLFVYDRQFYAADLAAGLYRAFPYYWGSLVVEFFLSIVMGLLYALTTFYMVGLHGSIGLYIAICIFTMLVSAQLAQLMALLASTQDIAMAMGCAYTAVSLLVSGFLVSYPSLGSTLSWAQWLAYPKYSLGALAINEFQESNQWELIGSRLQLHRVSKIGYDMGALALFSQIAAILSIISLRYLHKERR